jgi:hypothetical protein
VHCAPILKDAKAANILTVAEADFKGIGYLLQGTGISYRFLNTAEGKAILYLYRKKRLQDILRDSGIRNFLAQYGYQAAVDEENVEAALDIMSAHIRLFQGGESAFPHEIGIFLGYPLWDVQGFLENGGKNFAYLGYWKVYRDVQSAKRLFQKFDAIRELAMEELGRGMTLREIAV